MEEKIKQLEQRIEQLERLNSFRQYIPIIIQPNNINQNPNLHYHGTIPCYQNPCLWC